MNKYTFLLVFTASITFVAMAMDDPNNNNAHKKICLEDCLAKGSSDPHKPLSQQTTCFTCPECNRNDFTALQNLKIHRNKHFSSQAIVSDEKSKRRQKILTTKNEKIHKCTIPDCNFAYVRAAWLFNHYVEDHKLNKEQLDAIYIPKNIATNQPEPTTPAPVAPPVVIHQPLPPVIQVPPQSHKMDLTYINN